MLSFILTVDAARNCQDRRKVLTDISGVFVDRKVCLMRKAQFQSADCEKLCGVLGKKTSPFVAQNGVESLFRSEALFFQRFSC
jgi:hypothetical protein